MGEQPAIESRRASTDAIFKFLGGVPWWIVIVVIVGLIVGFSVLTNYRYLDAIYFILDLPWDKDLVAELPVEEDNWTFTFDQVVPLAAGEYKLYAEFYTMEARATPDEDLLTLFSEPSEDAAPADTVSEGEILTLVDWHLIPKEGLNREQLWAKVRTEDNRSGWALSTSFNQETYTSVATTEVFPVSIPEDAPFEDISLSFDDSAGESALTLNSRTPTFAGEVPAGVWIRVWDDYDFGQTLRRIWDSKGVMLTFRATLMGYGLAFILGLVTGLMLVSKNPITLAIAKLYVEVIRGIPMLVVILYAGFVIAPSLRDATGGRIELGRLSGAILGLGFGYGAYLAEVFRAGIQSIHHGQMEAARSLGMSYFQSMRYIILPQAIRVILPPLGNDFIAMLKDSSLISVVALPEILQQGRLWVSRTFRGFEGYNTVALFYVVLTLMLSVFVRFIERKAALPGGSEER